MEQKDAYQSTGQKEGSCMDVRSFAMKLTTNGRDGI